jgi:choice-of-anchor A domain-containing protein
MRSPLAAIVFSATVATLLVARAGLATPTWCQPRAALTPANPSDLSDPIAYVCSLPRYAGCCAAGGRWNVACVQKAALYDEWLHPGLDACGRHAWSQGPILGTGQYFPRDFSAVALSGSLTHLMHVAGPIAASGTVAISGFQLNYRESDDIAVITPGAFLSNGQVYGKVLYSSKISHSGVTFIGGWAERTVLPIDFDLAKSRLQNMSQALSGYTAIAAVKQYSTLNLVGTDPDLNVFAVDASQFTDTYDYYFDVPATSSVIVNVSGTAPVIQNAGIRFKQNIGARKMLWNFHQATTLTVQSTQFRGSILAPRAAATISWASLSGSIVAQSADVTAELYLAPFEFPATRGCLGMDPTWSCGSNTLVDDWGRAQFTSHEAGFLEIAGGDYTAEGEERRSPTHRVWYSFHPADKRAETKPLAVLFNGGPGGATMSNLAAFNTGPKTLDPQVTGDGQEIVNNPNSWTEFANILYIDAPATGFSYPLLGDGSATDLGNDMDRDAGNFLRVVARFLTRHPMLQQNRVIIVGESYGGARGVLMLKHLMDYPTLTDGVSAYQDAQLSADLADYFWTTFGRPDPTLDEVLSRFGHDAIIQGVVMGPDQWDDDPGDPYVNSLVACLSPNCAWPEDDGFPTCDPYNCDLAPNDPFSYFTLAYHVAQRIMHRNTLTAMLGTDPTTIEWLKPAARVDAFGREGGREDHDANPFTPPIDPATELVEALGELGPNDSYFVGSTNTHVNTRYGYVLGDPGAGAREWDSEGAGILSALPFTRAAVAGVKFFITNATKDAVVYSPEIPKTLNELTWGEPASGIAPHLELQELIAGASHLPGYELGWYSSGGAMLILGETPAEDIYIPMPEYLAGHSVSMRAPAELKSDIQWWLLRNPY